MSNIFPRNVVRAQSLCALLGKKHPRPNTLNFGRKLDDQNPSLSLEARINLVNHCVRSIRIPLATSLSDDV